MKNLTTVDWSYDVCFCMFSTRLIYMGQVSERGE